MKLLIGMTGSIGILSMPGYLVFLKQHFSEIKLIMTHSAEKFIPKETFSLLGGSVHTQLFHEDPNELTHIQLACWADIFIVLPATAHCMAQVAHGFSDTLLTAAILGHASPVIFFPNMNDVMWDNAATQGNTALLKSHGHRIIDPTEKMGYQQYSGQISPQKFMSSPQEVVNILEETENERMPTQVT